MTTTPYTQKYLGEHRGPTDSELYNMHSEQTYQDLTFLYNELEQVRNKGDYAYSALLKQIMAITNAVDELGERLTALAMPNKTLVFSNSEQIDNARFVGTTFELVANSVDTLTWQYNFGVLTLPYVADSSLSKIKYFNSDGTFNVANGLEVLILPDETTLDNARATVETSSPYDAVQAKPGLVWERNVIANAYDGTGAGCTLFIRIPNDLSITGFTNGIILQPFPVFDVDITAIKYTTDPNAMLNTKTNWTPLNSSQWYMNNTEAIGHIPPGGWTGDTMIDAGPTLLYFEPKAISALAITFKQDSYCTRANKYLYSYGLSDIDIRYDKFLATGKTMVKLDAPQGDTISRISTITPKIWNVSQAMLNDVFSYRVIWETSFGSGNYTLSPVAFSKRVWIEITLNQVSSGYTPVLSSMIATYT